MIDKPARLFTEKPIIMQSSSVRAIERTLKTETRRVAFPQPKIMPRWRGTDQDFLRFNSKTAAEEVFVPLPIKDLDHQTILRPMSPYTSDRLWVKQRWRVFRALNTTELEERKRFQLLLQYGADVPTDVWKDCDQDSFLKYAHDGDWKNPMFMPRWASRLTLDVLSVTLERLGDMTPADCLAEGIQSTHEEQVKAFGLGHLNTIDPAVWNSRTALQNFEWYWDIINGARGYPFSKDLWVWVIRFKHLKEKS